MDETTALRIRRRVFYLARKYRVSRHAEDLAQEILLKFIENPDTKQSVEYALLDILRKMLHRTPENRQIKKAHYLQYCSLIQLKEKQVEEKSSLFGYLRKCLSAEDYELIFLRFELGLTLGEIGIMNGYSESRASQIFTDLFERIKSRKLLERLDDDMNKE